MKKEAVEASIEGLKQAGIDFISLLPDSDWAPVQRSALNDPAFKCVSVSNEAIGVGVCAGAWLVGKKPALLIPTAGVLAAAFPLATLNMQKNIPLLLVVPYRGSVGDGIWFMGPYHFTTEPVLRDLHVAYTVVEKIEDIAPAITRAQRSAEAWLRPVAVLLGGDIIFEDR